MISNLLILLLLFFFGIIFLVGVIFLIIGLFQRNKFNWIFKAGIIISSFPLILLVLYFSSLLIDELINQKPDNKELVGTYRVTNATNLDFDINYFDEYKLIFYDDNSFSLTPTPYIEICDTGKFDVSYDFLKGNDLIFHCPNCIYLTTKIDRHFSYYRIEFIIGDPDSGERIYFEKIKE